MKTNILAISLVAVFLCLANEGRSEVQSPSGDQMSKLVSAIWKEPLQSVDVTVYRETMRPPMRVEDIRANVEAAYRASDKAAGNTDKESRAAELEREVQRIVREQQSPRISRQHIQTKSYYLYRLDEAVAPSGQQLGPNTPWTTTMANIGDPRANDHTHFEYNHTNQTATLFNDKQKWRAEPVDEWADVPLTAKATLKMLLGKAQVVGNYKVVVPDPALVEQATHGKRDGLLLGIESVPHGDATAAEVKVTGGRQGKRGQIGGGRRSKSARKTGPPTASSGSGGQPWPALSGTGCCAWTITCRFDCCIGMV